MYIGFWMVELKPIGIENMLKLLLSIFVELKGLFCFSCYLGVEFLISLGFESY